MRGGRFTRVNILLWLFSAVLLTVATYGIMSLFPTHRVVQMFTQRGPFQYVTVLFSYWCLLMLAAKQQKIRLQKQAVNYKELVPAHTEFVLSPILAVSFFSTGSRPPCVTCATWGRSGTSTTC